MKYKLATERTESEIQGQESSLFHRRNRKLSKYIENFKKTDN